MSDALHWPVCPKCGSDDVRGQKNSLERHGNNPFPSRSMYEYYCRNCHTLEEMIDDDPRFESWYARWWRGAS